MISWRPRLENFSFEEFPKLPEKDNLEVPPLLQRFLYSRNLVDPYKIDPPKIENLFEDLFLVKPRNLTDPTTMKEMDLAANRLLLAFKAQEKICIYADFDLDGTSGLALMLDGLKQLGFLNVIFKQPGRLSDGYGFHAHLVEELAKQGVQLIVTVDVGITDFEAVEKAKTFGIDVIITDHHQVVEKIPNALAVVNPNRPEDSSGLGYLCGAGVAFYLLRALKRVLVNQKLISEKTLNLQSLLDCFTIATLTDMVPLVADNRILVRLGLQQMELTKRTGLICLLERLDLSRRPLSSQDVAIRYAPKLNALSRMGGELSPIDLFLVQDRQKAELMVDQILECNAYRVQFQEEGEKEAVKLLNDWKMNEVGSGFVFLVSPQFHRGVLGLIATKIAGATDLPTFIGSIDSEGVIIGSGRLPNNRPGSLVAALETVEDQLIRFGGHEAAAGFELHETHLKSVIARLSKHYKDVNFSMEKKSQFFDVDARVNDIDEGLMTWLDRLSPFGVGFPVPLFRITGARINNIVKLRGGHLRFRLEDVQTKSQIEGILFSPPSRIVENLPEKGAITDLIAEIQWNYFGGNKSVQILVRDICLEREY